MNIHEHIITGQNSRKSSKFTDHYFNTKTKVLTCNSQAMQTEAGPAGVVGAAAPVTMPQEREFGVGIDPAAVLIPLAVAGSANWVVRCMIGCAT